MAFPTTTTLDNFNRADNSVGLGANWTADPFNLGEFDCGIISNTAYSSTTGARSDWYNVATYGTLPEVWIEVPTVSTSNGDWVNLCFFIVTPDTSGVDGYLVEYDKAATSFLSIWRIDNAGFTQLGADMNKTLANGDAFGMAMGASGVMTCYSRVSGVWASEGTRTDTTYTAAGYLTLQIGGDKFRVDNFSGGNAVAASFLAGNKIISQAVKRSTL